MTYYDLVGVPIPIDHPKFKEDALLQKKIRQIESFIEIEHDMEKAKNALIAFHNSIKNENQKSIMSLFDCGPFEISETILSFIIILYAKAFTGGTGRTKLKAGDIFGQEKEQHDYIMDLRNKFYAHQEIEANRHQIFCLPNVPSPGKITLNLFGQATTIVMLLSIDPNKIEFCVSRVEEFLISKITELCKNIEKNLRLDQIEVLTKTPKDELLSKYWIHNASYNPFSRRGSG